MAQTSLPTEDIGYIPNKLYKAEKRLEQFPYDTESWSVLIRDAQNKKIEDARPLFERLIAQFPNSGRYWKLYIEQEMKHRNYERVEKLFQRCLIKVLNIDLWKTYLNYIKETKGSLPSYREKMAQAYDFALDKIGMDIMSLQIWIDYINFLKSVEAVGSYAENQRITAVRKVYQRAVINPMIGIEQVWKEYNQYEQAINPLIAKKMVEDRGKAYANAKRVSKEYENMTKGLQRNLPSIPPTNTPEEAKQVELWKKYISWEKSNPLRTEDHAKMTTRVMFAFEQCLLCLGHHPDIWYEAACYLEQSSKLLTEKGDQNSAKQFADEAALIYERSTSTLMKSNMLLFFAYADFEEGRMKYEKVHSIYKKALGSQDLDPTLVYIQYMKFGRRAEGIKSARALFKMAREDSRCKYHIYIAAALMEYYTSKDKSVAFKIFELGLKKYGSIPEYVLAYLEYMSHLNEENNTRVLFERALSSGALEADKANEIWATFLEFETQIGDLASILKVEKRRAQLCEGKFGSETALLVDRYKYMDLYPCSNAELRALQYKDLSRQAKTPGFLSNTPEPIKTEAEEKSTTEVKKSSVYPKPDLNQMIPFKPRKIVPTGNHPIPGGVFPPPPAASELLSKLPPPTSFKGPFVVMDKFMENFAKLALPDGPVVIENGVDESKMDLGTRFSLDIASGARKRKILNLKNENEESDDEETVAPPAHDIYRARQHKKTK
ncbi:unnamed protein product [Owenia fusiformis]|uniref:Cleavage stimulation factor subunit 3 n=1 Tax=Owenia fusiformis TaxID=6347 RepID=A0A8J1XJ43_OWEFU|nr:unnamed protein product [Owenia fusiformis]